VTRAPEPGFFPEVASGFLAAQQCSATRPAIGMPLRGPSLRRSINPLVRPSRRIDASARVSAVGRLRTNLRNRFRSLLARLESRYDHLYRGSEAPLADSVSHSRWRDRIVGLCVEPGKRVLEVGSREVTCASDMRRRFAEAGAEYTGFDFYPGANVDVVGDAHRLSSYFEASPRFDLIYSSACFEHFAMPWIVATEIAKILSVGGHLFVETHFSFSSHERPWHFFHYTDMALRVLFSEALGFECLEAGFSNPLACRFSADADEYLRHSPLRGMYCHVDFLARKVRDVPDFRWETLSLDDVVGATRYPPP